VKVDGGAGNSLDWGFYVPAKTGIPVYQSSILWNTDDITPTEVVPAGLAASDAGTNGEIIVTWTNAASYRDVDDGDAVTDYVFVYDDSDDSLLGIGKADEGSLRITGLTNDTAYTVYAKASTDGYHFSGASGTASATPTSGISVPSAPTITAAAAGDGQVTLSITGVTGTCKAYYRATGTQAWTEFTGSTLGADGDLDVTGLTNGTPYAFFAVNLDGGLLSLPSNEVTATPDDGNGVTYKGMCKALYGQLAQLATAESYTIEFPGEEVIESTAAFIRAERPDYTGRYKPVQNRMGDGSWRVSVYYKGTSTYTAAEMVDKLKDWFNNTDVPVAAGGAYLRMSEAEVEDLGTDPGDRELQHIQLTWDFFVTR